MVSWKILLLSPWPLGKKISAPSARIWDILFSGPNVIETSALCWPTLCQVSIRTPNVLYSFLTAVHTFNRLPSTQHRWNRRINMRGRPHSTISCLSRDLSFGSRCYAEVLSWWAETLCWKKESSALCIFSKPTLDIYLLSRTLKFVR